MGFFLTMFVSVGTRLNVDMFPNVCGVGYSPLPIFAKPILLSYIVKFCWTLMTNVTLEIHQKWMSAYL